MNLCDLLHGVTSEPVAARSIAGIACHSKQVRSGDLFVALPGSTTDGHRFIEEAIARGAAAILTQQPPAWHHPHAGPGPSRGCPCIVVSDTHRALTVIAARFYGHPSRKLRLVGVTGTNGKTTTTYLLKAILEAGGMRVGLLGTIVYDLGERIVPSTNTTPGPLELQRLFAQMVGEGMAWCVMEVSSHALAQGRVDGVEFEGAVFTNLGSDHLDYHKTREAYAAAKRRLFEHLRPGGIAVVNTDDEYGRTLAGTIPNHAVATYGIERPATVSVTQVVCTWQGTSLVLETPWGVLPVTTPLLGRHNVPNLTAAATTLLTLGVAPDVVRRGMEALEGVPGRLELVPNELGINIAIDYAHTADALRLTLLSLRELTAGRLIVVFGCGGDRDQTKRPVMGKMASLLADYVLLTSDNPRSESPLDIVEQITAGFVPGFRQAQVVLSRDEAITTALSLARAHDTVLIAGKGHEAYQIFQHVAVPFVDRDVVERWLSARQPVAAV